MHRALVKAAVVVSILICVRPTAAQATADPNPGSMTLTGSFDVLNQYMFRGIRQNSTEVAMWPAMDLGIAAFSGEDGLKTVGVNVGTWNSLHTGDTGSDGPSSKLWYESDFYAALGLGFGRGVTFTTTYTAYTSPNNSYSTVKEMMFKLGWDDCAYLGKAAVKPYVIVAREFETEVDGLTNGQADGGQHAGTYLEIGAAPGYSMPRASIAVPIKVGCSLGDYYELAGEDHKFGFFSIAGIVTLPRWGHAFRRVERPWRRGVPGARYDHRGLQCGESNQVIGSFGIGFTY
jgi:uncharacterized protein (TIGR02001 family)